MATAAYGLINGDFIMWFEKWWLVPGVWLMATSASGLIDGFYPEKWRLLPMVWLMATLVCGLKNGDFCQWFEYWWFLLDYWLVGCVPKKWRFLPDRLIHGFYLSMVWLFGFYPANLVWSMDCYLVGGMIIGLYPVSCWLSGFTPSVIWLLGFTPSTVNYRALPHQWFVWRALPH